MTVDRAFAGLGTGALIVAFLTACGPTAEDVSAPAADPEILYSNVWSADRGIDLFSRGAELVRATTEAGEYTSFVGIKNSYPGYDHAVGGPARHQNPDKSEVATWLEPIDSHQSPRSNFRHITAFSATDTTVSAVVCGYSVNPTAAENITLNPLSDAQQIELANTGSSPGLPGIADNDPVHQDPSAHRPPDWNVFGAWRVTKIRNIQLAPGETIPQGCTDWWHQQFPTFTKVSDYNILTPPPGFQAPTQPVASQYPEWIGPARPE